MRVERLFLRNIEALNLIEAFLVSAVSSLLIIRFYLHLTGYPQIGGHGFHIAHMLFGGFLMMAALLMLLSFLSRRVLWVAAIIGGIGFGAFIDELGKFVTSDNNYFFEPTLALIYIIFVVLYLVAHAIEGRRQYTKTEYLGNAFDVLRDAVVNDLNHDEKRLAMQYLRKSDKSNPLVRDLHKLLQEIEALPKSAPTKLDKLELLFRRVYQKIVQNPLFYKAVILYFVIQSFVALAVSLAVVNTIFVGLVALLSAIILLVGLFYSRVLHLNKFQIFLGSVFSAIVIYFISESVPYLTLETVSIIEIGEIISTSTSVILIAIGIFKFKKSHLEAFKYFRYSILLSIFITQFFAFYRIQFAALVGLIINIVTLVVLEYMISREEEKLQVDPS